MLEYCGYCAAASGDLKLSLEVGGLKVQPRPKGGFPTRETPPGPTPPPFRVGFVGSDRVAMVYPPMKEAQGEFLRGADGTIAWLHWGANSRSPALVILCSTATDGSNHDATPRGRNQINPQLQRSWRAINRRTLVGVLLMR